MIKKNESPLSKKMKPVRIGLCALVLSSYLGTFGTIVEAATVDSSQASEVQVLETEKEKETKDVVDLSKEDSSSEKAEVPVVEEKSSEESQISSSVEESAPTNSEKEKSVEENVEVPVEEASSEKEATVETPISEKESIIEEEPIIVKEERALSEDNLLTNSDFSLTQPADGQWTGPKPENWELWIPNDVTTEDFTAEINEEKQLVLSSKEDTFRASVKQDLEVTSGETYKLSFDAKTEEKKSYVRVRITEMKNGVQDKERTYYSPTLGGTKDWTELEETFTVGPETDSVSIALFFEKGAGIAWFDNVQVEATEEVVAPPTETPEDATLEKVISLKDNEIYLTEKEEYKYVVRDTAIAENKGGLIFGRAAGETVVDVTNEAGEKVGEIPLTVEAYVESKFDKLLETWNGITTGNSFYDPTNITMEKQNTEQDGFATNIIEDYESNADENHIFDGITDYDNSKSLTASYRKIEAVAKQIVQPDSVHYQSERAIRMVKEAMVWLNLNAYNVESEIKGNWWDYEIGTPRAIGNSLSLLQDYFSQEEIMKYTDVIQKFVPDSYHFHVTTPGGPRKALGGNLINMGRVKIIQGALRQDEKIVKETVESVSQALQYAEPGGLGFFEDGSYIDHVNVAYTGAYGNVLIDGLSQLLPVMLQTGHLE